MSNKLKDEKSPYLLQHKDNPVDWYPWCQEAFQKAKDEDKPIFLSIGYSTCHWCHVMARESFEDAEVASLLQNFVCIKVDREERPDIDAVYMRVCQALTGAGGWPLTVFMTSEQKPFFAGTYFPKTNRHGQIGLMELLRQILHLWNTEKENIFNSGDKITAEIRREYPTENGEPDKMLLKEAYRLLWQSFDAGWGGFGVAPKFPTPHNLLFLMWYCCVENEPEGLQMVETTLNAMARGGIFDQIGGGFSRYSTDEKWLVPHFEKMLYDNALLIIAYLEAFQLTKNKLYAGIAKRTADYILRELTDPAGGFYCGQDADSDGIEGKYYVFTPDEIIRVLGPDRGKEFCRLYNINPRGNFEGGSVPNRIGQQNESWQANHPQLKQLYEYRKTRTRLHCDDKILLSWNAWTIIALARAGFILEDGRYLEAALKAQQFIETKMVDEQDRLLHRFRNGEAAHVGQLDDYAVYALAMLELYRVTFNIKYLQQAAFRAHQIENLFKDNEMGGYFMNAHDAEQLLVRPKEIYDGAIPSGNSVVAMVLEHLASLTGEPVWRKVADRQHQFIAGQMGDYPAGHSFALIAMAQSVYPKKELLCVGNSVPAELKQYLKKQPTYGLGVLFKSAENEQQLSNVAPFTKSYPLPEHGILWYLCENGVCKAPEKDFKKLNLL